MCPWMFILGLCWERKTINKLIFREKLVWNIKELQGINSEKTWCDVLLFDECLILAQYLCKQKQCRDRQILPRVMCAWNFIILCYNTSYIGPSVYIYLRIQNSPCICSINVLLIIVYIQVHKHAKLLSL